MADLGASKIYDNLDLMFNKLLRVDSINDIDIIDLETISGSQSKVDTHSALGGSSHPAVTTSVAGFMSSSDKTKLDNISTSANNYSHPNHTGDVTSSGDGATTITNSSVTLSKMANIDTARLIGRVSASTGIPEALTAASVRSMLNVEDGAQVNTVTSVASKTGAVSLVKGDVGLGNVDNKSSSTIRSEITSANVTDALTYTPVDKSGDAMTGDLTIQGRFSQGDNAVASGGYAHAEGKDTVAEGIYSHAQGRETYTIGIGAHAEGVGNVVGANYFLVSSTIDFVNKTITVEDGTTGMVAGQEVILVGNHMYYPNDGQVTFRTSIASISGSILTLADVPVEAEFGDWVYHLAHLDPSISNEGGHAEGVGTISQWWGHAEGTGAIATGFNSHAEGYVTSATGSNSHAEGYDTKASGNYSHAQGEKTEASGTHSHAEGYVSIASGNYSHAEGYSTDAIASYSHAEGQNSLASGTHSHAGGYYTIASGNYQTVIGKSNVDDGTKAFIIGNGGNSSSRSNALTVGWDGNLLSSGNIEDGSGNILSGKENSISAGTTSQYWRGDKSWQTLNKSAVGLGNVDNKSSATIRGEITSLNVTDALTYTPLSTTGKAADSELLNSLNSSQFVRSDQGSTIEIVSSGSALSLIGNNLDVDLHIGDNGSDFGFYWRYKGTGNGNDNDLEFWANNQAGPSIQVYDVKQDGNMDFLIAPTITGNTIYNTGNFTPSNYSLTTHDHDDDYNNYYHPTGFSNQPASALTGTSVITQVAVNTNGHVTGVSTRNITADNLGLGNVDNKSSATIRGELTLANITSGLGYTPFDSAGGTISGNVGIGVASPTEKLEVAGAIAISSKFKIEYNAVEESLDFVYIG